MEPFALTIAQTAQALQVSRAAAYSLAQRGALPLNWFFDARLNGR